MIWTLFLGLKNYWRKFPPAEKKKVSTDFSQFWNKNLQRLVLSLTSVIQIKMSVLKKWNISTCTRDSISPFYSVSFRSVYVITKKSQVIFPFHALKRSRSFSQASERSLKKQLGAPGWLSWLSVQLWISAQVMISRFMSSSPASGSVLNACSEPGSCFGCCVSLSLCPSPACTLSLSLKVNELYWTCSARSVSNKVWDFWKKSSTTYDA